MKKIFLFLWLILFSRLVLHVVPYGYDPYLVVFCASIYSLIFFLRIYSGTKNFAGFYYSPLKPDVLFLIFYALVFFVPYVQAIDNDLYLYGNKFIDNLFIENSNKAVAVATVYAGIFVFGALCGEKSKFCFENHFKFTRDQNIFISAYKLNIILLIIFMIIFEISGASSMMSGEYTGLGGGSSTSDGIYFLVTQFSMAAAAIFLVGCGSGVKIWSARDKLCQLIIFFWMLRLLASGDRNNFLLIMMIYIIGFSVYIKRVGFWVIGAIGGFGWLVYQVVEITRASGARSIVDFFDAIGKYSGNVEDQNISESSVSLTTTTLRASLDLQPFGDAIYYGWFKLVGFMGVIPYSRQLLSNPDDGFYTSAQLITVQVLGYDPTWSLGSNVISDVMLDFGVYGGGILMLILGYFSSMFCKAAVGLYHPLTSSFYLLIGALLFQMPRYSYDFPVRNFFWFLLIYFLSWFICSIKHKN